MKHLVLKLIAALAGIVLAAAPATAAPARKAQSPASAAAAVVPTATGGHVIGKPGAPIKLIEYLSYTCPHCAAFEKEATDGLLVWLVLPGKGSVEYRPLLRNAVDMAATLLVNCGPPARFSRNQMAVLRSQDKWMTQPSDAQQQRWRTGDFAARMRAIASDMNLYPLFEARGYSRPELDRCLADEAQIRRIADENRVATETLGVEGTPTFFINGKIQDAHDWAGLRPALEAAAK